MELHELREVRHDYGTLNTPYDRLADPPDDIRYSKDPTFSDDHFLRQIYDYYVQKGLLCCVMNRLVNALIILFMMTSLLFVFGFFDYATLRQTRVLSQSFVFSIHRIHPLLWITLILFSFFGLREIFVAIMEYRNKSVIREFYRDTLHIQDDDDLSTLEWHQIVDRLIRAKPDYKSPLDIALRIMRKENYIIALFNMNLLDLRIPCFRRGIYTRIIEWYLEYTVWDFIFDENGVRRSILIAKDIRQYAENLKKRIYIFSILNIFLSPFLFVFVVIYLICRYVEELRTQPSELGSRQWTRTALWKFREFNELSHLFSQRMYLSMEPTRKYLSQFPSYIIGILARWILFMAGTIAVLLLVLGLLNQDLLLNASLWGKDLIVYLGICGGIVAVTRVLIPPEIIIPESGKYLREISEHTHYSFDENTAKEDIHNMFTFSVWIYIQEVLSILVAPYILLYSLPSKTEELLLFFRKYTTVLHDLGHVCSLANFNEFRGSRSESHYNQERETMKLEKSMINFKVNHPQWMPPQEGQDFLNAVSQYGQMDRSLSSVMETSTLKLPETMRIHANFVQSKNRSPV